MSIREIEVKQDLILNANKNPKGYFKCIFIAGPPASGKTTIVTQLFSHDINLSSYNLMIANPDQYFESLLSKYNVSYDRRAGKQSKEQWDKQQQLWELSKELFYKKLKSTISDKTGLIIDVTGAGFDSLIKRKFMVQNTGYDVMMIYVSCGLQLALRRNSERTRKIPQQYLISAHDILQKYKIRYQRIFGDNFIDISTNTSQPTAVNDYIKTKVASFLNKPISNSIAQRWILKQRELSNDLNPKPFNIQQDATQNEMRKICMFAGRFQPFTPSHFKAYTIAVQRFGKQNVFISTSNVTNNKNSPFNFQQKQLIISTMFNIPKENIILNKSPYSVQVFSNMVDTQNTILYVINTQKDDRLTRSGGYFKSKQPKTLKPFSQQAYIFNVGYPHENYKGVELSGTYLRSLFTNEDTSVQQKKKIFKQIYGKFDQTIFKLIMSKLNPNVLITQGGAYGHLDHPYDDPELSFSTIKEMISDVLSGQINVKSEQQITIKTDGQNLLISWRDGKLIAARNKGHLKANGANALDSNTLKSLFAGRGEIQKAFSLAMDDLSQAFGSLSQRQLKEIFNEGQRWISIQIIYDGTTNVIVYGKNMLVFHGIISVDPDGNKTSFDKNMTRQIYRIFTNINSNIQNTFEIKPTTIVNIPKSKDFSERRSYFLNKVDKLQNKYNLSQQNTIQDYIKSAWTPIILQYAEQANYDIPKDILSGLLLRWAQNDSSYSLLQFKKDCNNPQFLRVAIDIDKNSKQSITKDILYPWQIIFLELGVQVMKNLNQYMVAHPSKTISKIRSEVEATIDTIKSSNNIKYLNQLERPLKKLEAIGGLDSIVPQQGVVFNYKGKNYKLTGSFAPVNAILGIIRYAR